MKVIFGKYIVTDPNILTGKPVIKGTRIPIDLILKKLAQSTKTEEIMEDYPRLKKEHVQEILSYAHSLVAKEKIYPLSN